MDKSLIISIILSAFWGILPAASYERNVPLCFQFTWLGPRYTNDTMFLNETCQDPSRLSKGVPCQPPLVVSYDGTWPDVNYIWSHYSQSVTCVLEDNDVCAKYTYYFDGHVENSTYMCTRAIDSNNTAITSGCYEETNGSYSTRVCICRSIPGGYPCNSGTILALYPLFSVIMIITLIFSY